jgi:two-component sensor histidine kinase/ligand-binding sensor domain-containing protein
LFAQTYNFEYFNVEEGLSQSTVNAISQDERGYLWVGTAGGGVCKFDGVNFTTYTEKEGLSGDIVTGITEDNNRTLWFTSTWGGVSKYDGRKFYILDHKDGLINEKNQNTVFKDKKGSIWLGGNEGVTHRQNGKLTKYTKENSLLIGDTVNKINEDIFGNIWICTTKGITVIKGSRSFNITKADGLPSNNVTAIEIDENGNCYIGTDKGIVKLLAGSISPNNYEYEKNIFTGMNAEISGIVIDKEKNIWIATKKTGAYLLNNRGILTHLSKDNGLATSNLNTLFLDKSGNVWIGTNGSGLIKYGNKAFTSFDKVNGLNNSSIYSIISDKKNDLWVGTGNDGIYKYDGISTTHFTTKNGLNSNEIRVSLLDNKGYLWFATNNGLARYKNGVFKNFTTKDGLPSNQIRSLLQDDNGNLWIGTYGKGLSVYDYSTFKNFTVEKDGLSHNYIYSLYQDKKGIIWIGTGNGVNKYVDGKFTNYSKANGFCNSFISCITEDKFGDIWFGTDRCAVKYNGVEFKSITTDDGLASGVIYLIHGDKQGNLWIGTNSGIDKITFDSYGEIDRIKNYKSKQGFKGIECNNKAIYEDNKGNLWIGTVKGLIKYNPTQDKTNVFEPKINIDNIRLFFEDVNWHNYSKDITRWSNLPKKLILPHHENHLTFEFSAINLTFPEDVQYRFKLTPFDKEWFSATEKTSTTYSNLPPGKYTFEVKARNEDGVWNQQPATFSFEITAPWWKEWWVLILISLFIFYVIYKLSSYKEKQQREISRELEAKVKERTSLIETQRDEKEILLKEIHHRVKNNMQVIISLLSIQSGYTKDEAALALFDEAKNRIHSMALIHEKMYQTGDLAHIDFKDYIKELTNDLIDTYSINCDILLDIKIDDVKFNIDTLIPLGLLLNEIISNALKYAFIGRDTGTITIHFTIENENNYTLLVGDNGMGIPKEVIENEDGNLGMELIKIFVSQIDGDVKILEKEGAFFEIKFSD